MDPLEPLRRVRRRARRHRVAMGYLEPRLAEIPRWLRDSREVTNFTHDLDPLNLEHPAAFVATVADVPLELARGYLRELEDDRELADHVSELSAGHADADPAARFGRRAGWYALTRISGPPVVVETGVHHGLGAVTIAAALRRNAAEGHPGRYVGTDIDPDAGWLLARPYAEVGEVLYGDSIVSLRSLREPDDLFVSDSDHSPDYEAAEYRTIADVLSPGAVLLSDNAHVTDRLLRFADDTGRRFLLWPEQPLGDWYPGAGIGAAW